MAPATPTAAPATTDAATGVAMLTATRATATTAATRITTGTPTPTAWTRPVGTTRAATATIGRRSLGGAPDECREAEQRGHRRGVVAGEDPCLSGWREAPGGADHPSGARRDHV